jgi:glycosyltransferase involved in cell wall biosynthesis
MPFHYLMRLLLIVRSAVQRHDLRTAALVLCPSETFMREVEQDYGIARERMRVLRHPVDLAQFSPNGASRDPERPIRLLFVARMAVRKGLEMVIALSHRLADLEGGVRIELIGDRGIWSDYTSHLSELDGRVGLYVGPTGPDDLATVLREGDALLVPSRYEPGSLIVGQALASGLPVIASDSVGPTEVVSPRCCRVFPSGDLDALEGVTRQLVDELRGDAASLSRSAREQAVELMSPEAIRAELERYLAEAVPGLERVSTQ